MRHSRNFRAAVAAVTMLSVTAVPLLEARAGLVSTEAVLQAASAQAERERIDAFLGRADVAAEMERYGISPDEARQRVAAMSDEEVRQLAGRLDRIPAGGNALGVVVGAAVLIFVVLLITDIAGLTKVFPWTRSVR